MEGYWKNKYWFKKKKRNFLQTLIFSSKSHSWNGHIGFISSCFMEVTWAVIIGKEAKELLVQLSEVGYEELFNYLIKHSKDY